MQLHNRFDWQIFHQVTYTSNAAFYILRCEETVKTLSNILSSLTSAVELFVCCWGTSINWRFPSVNTSVRTVFARS